MNGIASTLGVAVDDDTLDLATLDGIPVAPGCSTVWTSSRANADGHARVSRNLDFSTETVSEFLGQSRQPGEVPVFSRPYLIETYPDDAHASIIAVVGDLSGCLDGINEHGLVVALLSDDESATIHNVATRPSLTPQAGLNELHLLRYLLETCATAAEAKEALFSTKQYDQYAVAHYLIADEDHAFVWERDTHNAEYAVDADRDSLFVTNYLLHRRDSPTDVPADIPNDAAASNMYLRARMLNDRVTGKLLTGRQLWAALEAVRFDPQFDAHNPGRQVRTLWHSQYDIEHRSATFEFYLGDQADGSPCRSSPVTLQLADTASTAEPSTAVPVS
jgi:hypothetical protein